MSILTDFFAASPDSITVESLTHSPAGRFSSVQSLGLTPLELAILDRIIAHEPVDSMGAVERMDNFLQVLEVTRDGPWVYRFPPALQAALATATDEDTERWATRWVQAEELAGMDPEDLVELLGDVATLAREAASNGLELFVWTSL